jgi:hypothetical protein
MPPGFMRARGRVGCVARLLLLFGSALTIAQGCAPPENEPERLGQTEDNVNGGIPDSGAVPKFPEVVWIQMQDDSFCSGRGQP